MKLLKHKTEQNKYAPVKGTTVKLAGDFLMDMKEARRQWNIFKGLHQKERQARILYPVKTPSKYEGAQKAE